MGIKVRRFIIDKNSPADDIERWAESVSLTRNQLLAQPVVQVAPGVVHQYFVYIDEVPPEVSRTVPRDGETLVQTGADIVVYFTEDVAVTAAAIEIRDGASAIVTGWTHTVTDNVLTISGAVTAVTTYTIALSASGVTDSAGNTLERDYQFQFATTATLATDLAGAGLENDGSGQIRIATSAVDYRLTGGGGTPLSVTIAAGVVARMTANDSTNVGVGDHIAFNAATVAGSNISLDTASGYATAAGSPSVGRFTLTANRTYLLVGQIDHTFGGTTGVLEAQWYNATTGSALSGATTGRLLAVTSSAHRAAGGLAIALFTPTVSTLVELQITSVTAGSQTNALGTAATIIEL